VLYRVGRLSEAAALLRDTLEHCKRVLPQEDPLIRSLRESLKNVGGE
jgi:hypothetical protein